MYKQLVIDNIETNYLIYDNGDCFNIKTNKFLKGSIKNSGYKMYNLSINGKKKDYSVHRLVAQNFIPNPNNYPVVNHIDGNKINNNMSNLEWVTHSENRQHSYDNNLCNKRDKQEKYVEDLENEYWKQFHDTNYYISNLGRVRNIKNNNLLNGTISEDGYKRCTLRINGKSKSYLIHRLVYFTFNPEIQENDKFVINHINGDKTDNKIENLEYITKSENVLHGKYALDSKKGKKKCFRIDENNITKKYESLTNAAKDINGTVSGISHAIKNKNKYMNYYWEEYEE